MQMTLMTKREQYKELCEKIWYHNKRYFVDNDPEISDEQFDALMKSLEKIEKKSPELISKNSPTQRVGEMTTGGFSSVLHEIPMLSLANTYSQEELQDFSDRLKKLVGSDAIPLSAEIKMDGIAVSVRYEKGKFIRAVTRGNGKKGDDITVNVKTIAALPLQLLGDNLPDILEIRGEIFMPREIFLKLNEEREKREEPLWANPRNAAGGSLKLLDPEEVARRRLSIVVYSVAQDSSETVVSQFESHAIMKAWGLPTLDFVEKCENLDAVSAFAEKVLEHRSELSFDIDGIVLKLNDFKEQKRLGVTGKNPRWAVAYKFAAEQETTFIKEITVQVGRTGTLTPVAELEPVFLAGSTISRASLHNEEEIQRKDIRVGDRVIIEKGGDVIPKVVEVDKTHRKRSSTSWVMPTHCPACETEVVRVEGEVAVRCPNLTDCPKQLLRRIAYFASKHAMDIDHMGEKIVEQLVNESLVSSPSDIYSLKEEQLVGLEGFKEKAISNLLSSIENSKVVPLQRFIMALGIPFVGAGTAELLANKAGTLQILMVLTEEELLEIDGVGDKVVASVLDYFTNEAHLKEIESLLKFGVTPREVKVTSFKGHPFSGNSFVLTGTLENYTRQAAAALIKERGGKVVGSVSKKTNYLLAGASAGSKRDKAESLGVKILSEEEFVALL